MQKLKIVTACVLLSCAFSAWADDLLVVYQHALGANPTLKSAQLKAGIGAEQKGQALGQLLPQVTGVANWSKNDQTSGRFNLGYSGTRYTVSLNQSLIDFAKFWDWRRASKIEAQYEAEAIEAQNKLIFDVVDRYFSVLEAEDQLQFTRTEKQATEKQLQQVQKQFSKQLLKITDVYAVEARQDQLAANEILAESQLTTAKEGLRELTGEDAKNLSKLRDDVDYKLIEGGLQQWLEMAQIQSPMLSARRMAIEAEENNVAVQKSRYLPVVDLQLGYYETDTGYQNNPTPKVQTQVAAINLTVPIFSGGTTTHQVYEAQHRLEISKNDNESALRALVKETSDAFLTTNANVRHIKAAQKTLESAAKSRESMELGLKYGVVTVSDLLKAQQEEFLSLRNLAQAKYAYIKNKVRFLRAIGSVNDGNVQEINAWLVAQ